MADDFWTRKRKQEEEEEREREEEKERAARLGKKSAKLGLAPTAPAPVLATDFHELTQEATVLIEQLIHLYNHFLSGVNALPPREIRSRLDHIMVLLMNQMKPTPATRFQFNSIQSSYTSHTARWDKMMKDLESGRVKRTVGPKRGT